MIGFIFDCDGTLVDSEPLHFQSWNLALQKYNHSLSKEDYLNHCSGHAGVFVSEALGKKLGLSGTDILDAKRFFYKELQKQGIPPIERTVKFAHELIAQKQRLGIKLAVASAAYKREILDHLEHIGLLNEFDAIVSGEADLHHINDAEGVNKPKPYIYLHTAKLLNLDPKQCVAFEDSGPGVLSATRAGITTIALPNEYTVTHDFSPAELIIQPNEEISYETIKALICSPK